MASTSVKTKNASWFHLRAAHLILPLSNAELATQAMGLIARGNALRAHPILEMLDAVNSKMECASSALSAFTLAKMENANWLPQLAAISTWLKRNA